MSDEIERAAERMRHVFQLYGFTVTEESPPVLRALAEAALAERSERERLLREALEISTRYLEGTAKLMAAVTNNDDAPLDRQIGANRVLLQQEEHRP